MSETQNELETNSKKQYSSKLFKEWTDVAAATDVRSEDFTAAVIVKILSGYQPCQLVKHVTVVVKGEDLIFFLNPQNSEEEKTLRQSFTECTYY
jgi:hypothetical protein